MLGNVIFSMLFIILVIFLYRNEKRGIIFYLIFSLISPNFNIEDLQISFEIIGFFLVAVVWLLKKSHIFSIHKKYLYRQHLAVYLYIYIIAGLLAAMRLGSTISWISFLAIFRMICIIYILQYVMKENQDEVLDSIISPVLFINFIVSFIQLTIPQSTKLFYDLYYKNSLTPLLEPLNLGYFNRAYGTFGTPVLLGVFAVFSFSVYFGFFIEKKNIKQIYLKLILSIVIGLLALSKTAILGLVLILITIYFLVMFGVVKVKNLKIVFIPLIIVPVFILTVHLLKIYGMAISWYIGFLSKPFEALKTRYDVSSGILAGTYSTISQNWLIGVGPTAIGNDFTGDSMYIGLLYNTGIIGFVIYFGALLGSFIKNIKMNRTTALLCFIAICFTGFAAPIHLHIMSVSLIAYMFCSAEAEGLIN